MDEIDRILSSEEPLIPSSGFEARVMEAVRTAAPEPPPLAFPWPRFLTGVVACAAWAWASAGLAREVDPAVHARLAEFGPELGYAAAAVLASVVVLYGRRILTEHLSTEHLGT